jgi:hypothetical protein
LAFSRATYSSNLSAGTSKAMWFIEPWAVTMSPTPGSCLGEAWPGWAGGALANQKKASESPLPMSKKEVLAELAHVDRLDQRHARTSR